MKTLKFVSPDHILLEGVDMYISAEYLSERPTINYTNKSWIKFKNQIFFLKGTSSDTE